MKPRSLRPTVLLAVALFASWPALSGCGSHKNQEPAAQQQPGAKDGEAAGKVTLSRESIKAADIQLGRAGPATIDVTLDLPGEVKLNAERVLDIKPRFAGVVHEMRKRIGDVVRGGETVALVQSNESLTDYAVSSAMSGRVVARSTAPGQAVTPDASLYTIADLSTVWVEFAIYPQQLGVIRRGQPVRISPQSGQGPVARGTISYIGPVLQEDTRVSIGRVVLSATEGRWQPGMFVTVTVTTDHQQVPVAVPDEALVRIQDGSAVFVADSTTFELRPVVTGKSDGRFTQIVSGIDPGTPVVVHNAFTVKSELEKSTFAE